MSNTAEPQQEGYTPSFDDVATDAPALFSEDEHHQTTLFAPPKKDDMRIVVLIAAIILLIGNTIWCGFYIYTEHLPSLDFAQPANVLAFVIRILGALTGIVTSACGIISTLQRVPKKKQIILNIVYISGLALLFILELVFWITFLNTIYPSEAKLIGGAVLITAAVAVLISAMVCGLLATCSGVRLRYLKKQREDISL